MKKLLLLLGLACTQISLAQTKEKVNYYKFTYMCTKCGEEVNITKRKPQEVKNATIRDRVKSDNNFDRVFTDGPEYKIVEGRCIATGNKHIWKTSDKKTKTSTYIVNAKGEVSEEF